MELTGQFFLFLPSLLSISSSTISQHHHACRPRQLARLRTTPPANLATGRPLPPPLWRWWQGQPKRSCGFVWLAGAGFGEARGGARPWRMRELGRSSCSHGRMSRRGSGWICTQLFPSSSSSSFFYSSVVELLFFSSRARSSTGDDPICQI